MTFLGNVNYHFISITIYIAGCALAKHFGLLSSFNLKLGFWPTALLIVLWAIGLSLFIYVLKVRKG